MTDFRPGDRVKTERGSCGTVIAMRPGDVIVRLDDCDFHGGVFPQGPWRSCGAFSTYTLARISDVAGDGIKLWLSEVVLG